MSLLVLSVLICLLQFSAADEKKVFHSVPEAGANTLTTIEEAMSHCASLGATIAKKKQLFKASHAASGSHCDAETQCAYLKGGNAWKVACKAGEEAGRCPKKPGYNAWCFGIPPEVPEPVEPVSTGECPAFETRQPDHFNSGRLRLEDYDRFEKMDCFGTTIYTSWFVVIPSIGQVTVNECLDKCNTDDQCTGFSHYPDHSTCVLYSLMCPKFAVHDDKLVATWRKPAYSSGLNANYLPYIGAYCGDPNNEMKQVGYANWYKPWNCRKLCMATKGCCGFITNVEPSIHYVNGWGGCHLMNTTTTCTLQKKTNHVYYRIADDEP